MSTKKETTNKPKKKNPDAEFSGNRFLLIASLILVVITSGIYLKSLNNPFTNWDDDSYIINNADIRSLSSDNVKKTFTSYVMGNYHPLTMLSYCVEYDKFKLNHKPYHVTNLILHILNTLLVLCFVWLLTKQQLVAFFTALFFAIHPMHVESVAWVAERKDVLYAFFYLAAVCTYLLFIQKEKHRMYYYVLTLVLFLLAVLSKGMAVSLPILLFAIDYYIDRKISTKTIIEKIPFLLLSIIFGLVAIQAQKSVEALYDLANYNFFDRIIFSCYGVMTYIWKAIIPINLSCYYSYPDKHNGMYPVIYYLSPLIVSGLAYLIYRSLKFGKDIAFGFSFFIIAVILVLQLLPVGGTIIAERYSYLPYIGLFFIAAKGVHFLVETKDVAYTKYKNIAVTFTIVFALFFSYQSFVRTKVWHGNLALWDDAIEKYDKAPLPFKCRAVAYFDLKEYNNAIADLNKAIALQNTYAEAYNIRGQCYNALGNYNEAVSDYTSAITNNPKYAVAYNNRGIAYYNLLKFKDAINDYTKAILLDAHFIDAYNNRGNALFNTKDYTMALADYNKVISINPNYAIAYNGRGLAQSYSGNLQEAIKNYTAAVTIDPNYAQAYLNRGNANYDIKKYNEAINDYTTAIEKNAQLVSAYYLRAGTYFTMQQYQLALNDVQMAKQLGFAVDPRFVEAIEAKLK